ncbi:MAG TPA: hypothetical protein VGC97_17885 [Pyrinomonadaceae bacterium]|jgi:hypothetical protein
MHNVDIELVDMSPDVIKFAIKRITNTVPELGFSKSECELKKLVGETITPEGITGEKAFALFRDVLIKASVPINHRRHLAFVPASPTRAAVMFDLVTSAANVHGAFWLVVPTKVRQGTEFETVARFCFINPDTTEDDIKAILETME